MRQMLPPHIELGRFINDEDFGTPPNSGPNGVFVIRGPDGVRLRIISSSADVEGSEGWDHVSVSSTASRVPNWQEMCFVKDGFFEPEETVVQFHPPQSVYVNNHPFVLHLWADKKQPIRLPNPIFVGIKDDGTYRNVTEAEAGITALEKEEAFLCGVLAKGGTLDNGDICDAFNRIQAALTVTSTDSEPAQPKQDRDETLRGLAAFFSESAHHVWSNDEIADCLTNMIGQGSSISSTEGK